MKKQLTSFILILTMILAMLPQFSLTVFAATVPDTSIGLDFTKGATDWTGTGSYAGVSWVSGTKTLTLTNANIHGIDNASGSFSIKVPGGTTVVLNGSNTTTGGISADMNSDGYGLYSTGALTIQGTGSLVATGGASNTGAGVPGYSDGISLFSGTLTISGGTVTATGGSADLIGNGYSTGISADTVTISGGIVTATAGSAYTSLGMKVNTVNLNGGLLIARGGVAGNESKAFRTASGGSSTVNAANGAGSLTGSPTSNYAVYGNTSTYKVNTAGLDFSSNPGNTGTLATNGYQWVQSSKTLNVSNLIINTTALSAIKLPDGATLDVQGTNVVRSGNTATDYDKSYGINVAGDLTIQNTGTITIIGGNSTGATFGYSYGVFANNINISSAAVNAFAGTSTSHSYGIYSNGGTTSVNISSGSVTAIGGTTTIDTTAGGTTGSFSCGIIQNSNKVTISGGNITAIGGTVSLDDPNTASAGIFTLYAPTITGGNITAIGGVTPNSTVDNSSGIYLNHGDSSTISGGNITVIGNVRAFKSAGLIFSNNEGVTLASTNVDGSSPVSYVDADLGTYKYVTVGVPTYTATVNLKEDGSTWTGSSKTITLQQASETPTTTTEASGVFTANVTNGTWEILADGADTGRAVVINNAAASQDLNYYTVHFGVNDSGTASGSTISAAYNSLEIKTGDAVLGGKQLVITAAGHGASSYTYAWSGAGTSGETTAALTILSLSGAVNATCVVNSKAPKIITTSLPDGTVGTEYNQSLSAMTIAPITWDITTGSLSAGLSLDPNTGAITGTLTMAGTSTFTVQASNSNGSDTKTYTVTVSAAPVTYTLTITAGNGGTVSSAGGTYAAGAPVSITATPKSNYSFSGWTTSNSGNFADASSASTTFTMPANNTTITADFTYNGHAAPAPTPSDQSAVPGSVVDDNTGNQISNFTAVATTDKSGNYAVSMDETSAIQIEQPDGTKGAIADTSKIAIETPKDSTVSISASADGKIQVQGLVKGSESNFDITYDLGNGQKIAVGKIEIKVDNDGNINIISRLIDPYGIITDAYTGKPVSGVDLTLYYADTARNIVNGKTPGTIVPLLSINGFKPNNNANPQLSDANGAFGFMVFPDSDYYLAATKDGYDKYVSPTISVEKKIVKWDFKMNEANQIKGLDRFSGSDRIDTDLSIMKAAFSGKVSNVILATADNYPDALSGSVLAYNLNAPILLVGSSDASQGKVLSYIKNNMDAGGTVYILGGYGAVSEQVEGKLKSNEYNNITRIGRTDRYETSAKIAKQLDVKSGTPVVLASGEDYPDALSISSIAAANGYPVLLVNKDGISNAVKEELMKINPQRVYIIGLQGAVGTAVENEITSIVGINSSSVIRIGGQDRFGTSVAVAKYFKQITSSVCIATGNDFPDALAGSIYAAKYNDPIILVNDNISDDAMSYFKNNNLSGITIFGGEGAVNKNIEEQLSQTLKH